MNPNTLLMGAIKAYICKNYSFFMRRGRSTGASYRGHSPSLVVPVSGFKHLGYNSVVDITKLGSGDVLEIVLDRLVYSFLRGDILYRRILPFFSELKRKNEQRKTTCMQKLQNP